MDGMPKPQEQSVSDAQASIQDIVQRCLAGDEAAWHEFVDRHSRLVYSIPRRYGFDRESSEDIFQDAFLAAYRSLGSIQDPQSIPKWLITTTVRICAKSAKAAKKAGQLRADFDKDLIDDRQAERLMQIQELRAGLERLGGRCERLLTALYCGVQTPNYDEIADLIGIPRGSLGPTRRRCLKKLAALLNAEHD